MLLVVGLGVWGWSLYPDRVGKWAFVVLFLPLLWGYVELMQGGTLGRERSAVLSWHRAVFAWTGLLFALDLGTRLAIDAGLLDAAWAPNLQRVRLILVGAALAIWGNYLPKILSPWRVEDQPFEWQKVHRFAGWVVSLAGVSMVVVWFVLPLEQAKSASGIIVGTAFSLAIGRKLVSVVGAFRNHLPAGSERVGAARHPLT
jgi:hypothetical protein